MKKIIKDAKTFAQEKVPYIVPQCTVIHIEEERFFCTSIHPGKDGSTEDDWEDDEDTDGEADLDIGM